MTKCLWIRHRIIEYANFRKYCSASFVYTPSIYANSTIVLSGLSSRWSSSNFRKCNNSQQIARSTILSFFKLIINWKDNYLKWPPWLSNFSAIERSLSGKLTKPSPPRSYCVFNNRNLKYDMHTCMSSVAKWAGMISLCPFTWPLLTCWMYMFKPAGKRKEEKIDGLNGVSAQWKG